MRAVRLKVIGPEKRVRPRQKQCETILLLKSVSLKMSESEHSDSQFYYPCELSDAEMLQHYSRNEAMLPRAASFHQRMKMNKWSYDKILID